MRDYVRYKVALLGVALVWGIALHPNAAAQSTSSLTGTVKDPTGAVLPGTTVTLTPTAGGQPATAPANAQGAFEFRGVAPGTYTVSVTVSGFTPYTGSVTIAAGQAQRLNISLEVASVNENVQVAEEGAPHVDIAAENNASATTITEKDLDAFSDDPDELEAQLLALAGPSVGPNGGQIYVDGFTMDAGSDLPPKNAIREIRINQNPFSSQYDRLGYGRIEILTKPGTNQYHGRFSGSGNDLVFDTSDPLAATEPGYYSFLGLANVSGPLGKKGSFFWDYQHRNIVNDAVVSAETLNSSQDEVPYAVALTAPNTLDLTGPRLDFALGANNILSVSYQFSRQNEENLGVGQFDLPSQGYTLYTRLNTVRVRDTQIVGTRFVNELSVQAQRQRYTETPVSTEMERFVAGGFTDGGNSQGGLNYHHHHEEFDDVATYTHGQHTFTFGGRTRIVTEPYISPGNFNGTYSFSSLTNLEAVMKGTATPTQFTLTVGNPLTKIFSQDTGVYLSDDWRLRRNILLSYGLRFETQNFIPDHADWAPRLGVAWGVGRKSSSQTVVRAGFGIFYDRFSQQLELQVEELNGINQTEYVVDDPTFYNNSSTAIPPGYPNAPTPAELLAAGAIPTVYGYQPKLHAPYTIQEAIGVERQLTKVMTVSVTYLNSRGDDQFISNNVNAPLPGTYTGPGTGTRPNPQLGNVYEYESKAIFRQNQLITNVNYRASRGVSLFGTYTLSYVNSDTAGAGSFPDNPYNIAEDYGRAAFDIRSRILLGGTIALKYGIVLSPLLNFQSGTPFNFTIGQDVNGSSILNQRPSYATGSTPAADTVTTAYGKFNIDPSPSDTLVPINAGQGPSNVVFNMRAARTFTFGKEGTGGGGGGDAGEPASTGGSLKRVGSANQASGGGNLGTRGLGSGAGGSGGSGPSLSRRYSLTVSADARNLLNDVNLAPPVGTVTSPLFGKSNATAGGVYSFSGTNRRIDFQLAFGF